MGFLNLYNLYFISYKLTLEYSYENHNKNHLKIRLINKCKGFDKFTIYQYQTLINNNAI